MPSSNTRSAKGAGTIRKKTITNNGKNYTYWEARYTVGTDPVTGKQIQRSVTGKSKTEVSQKLRQATVEIDQGTYVDPTKLTVNEWMDFWQKEYLLGVKPSTANLYKECIRLYISPLIGSVRMDKLTGPMVQRFYNELYLPSDPGRNPVSPKSVKNVHGILHKAFQQAVRNGMLRLNPTESCVLPKIYKKEIQPLTSEQIAALLRILPGHPHEYLFQIALYTGMREGELLGLTWDCVDFAHGTILVKQQLQREHKTGGEYHLLPTKNGKKRVVPMAPSVARLFELQKTTVYCCFKRVVEKIGAPHARFHDLRHSYAVICIESGVDIKTLQENLGHATAAFTMDVYGHVSRQMQLNSASKLESFIQNINEKVSLIEEGTTMQD